MLYRLLYILGMFIIPSFGIAQTHYAQVYKPDEPSLKAAIKAYRSKMPYEAVRMAQAVIRNYSTDVELQYVYGASIIQTYAAFKSEAVGPLEFYIKRTASPDWEAYYFLGIAYQNDHQFEKAIEMFEKYKGFGPYPNSYEDCDIRIQQCKNAPQYINNPIDVTFENLGDDVNSTGEEYHPVVPPDESYVVFSTKREETTGAFYSLDGSHTPDVFMSELKRGEFKEAKSIGPPNSFAVEEVAGISENGEFIVYHMENETALSDLFFAPKKRRTKYDRPTAFTGEMVQKDREVDGSLSNDGNTLIMSAIRDEGKGGYDLYTVRKLPDGNWGMPEPIETLNTVANERAPYLCDEGKTMFFSSQGHSSIGGYDLFMTTKDENGKWTKPVNLGYPLNTTDDEMSICFAKNRRYAYTARYRADSKGGRDIYRVTFHEMEPDQTVLQSVILDNDSIPIKASIMIEVANENGKVVGQYKTDANSGKFIMILPPGKYQLQVLDSPYKNTEPTTIEVFDKNRYKPIVKFPLVLSSSKVVKE